MKRIQAKSRNARDAIELVTDLQERFVRMLEAATGDEFQHFEWFRDQGRHGGGTRFSASDTDTFNQASVNFSSVHYDDMPEKKLSSANAISTIIHPKNACAPSMHMHISWTEMRDGNGYWRMMADLNPSNPNDVDKERFVDAIKEAGPAHYEEASAQGDRYFNIPALQRHRGITHYYLEAFHSGDRASDRSLAKRIGEATIDAYVDILKTRLKEEPSATQKANQLAYHSLYLLQVLTLDRGTTSGLMVHDQNDVGIMGSLPAYVDRNLLSSWAEKMPAPQGELLDAIVAALPATEPSHLSVETRLALAQVVRSHYRAHPEALHLQASGNVVPPTVQNHR